MAIRVSRTRGGGAAGVGGLRGDASANQNNGLDQRLRAWTTFKPHEY